MQTFPTLWAPMQTWGGTPWGTYADFWTPSGTYADVFDPLRVPMQTLATPCWQPRKAAEGLRDGGGGGGWPRRGAESGPPCAVRWRLAVPSVGYVTFGRPNVKRSPRSRPAANRRALDATSAFWRAVLPRSHAYTQEPRWRSFTRACYTFGPCGLHRPVVFLPFAGHQPRRKPTRCNERGPFYWRSGCQL